MGEVRRGRTVVRARRAPFAPVAVRVPLQVLQVQQLRGHARKPPRGVHGREVGSSRTVSGGRALDRLLCSHGLYLADAERVFTLGGSLRLFLEAQGKTR